MKWHRIIQVTLFIIVLAMFANIKVGAEAPKNHREYLVTEHLGPNSDIPWQQLCITDHGPGYFTVSDLTGDGFEDNLHLTILFRDVFTNQVIDAQLWQDDYYSNDECQECLNYCYENCSNLDEYLLCEQACQECYQDIPRPTSRIVYHDMPVNMPRHIKVELRTIERECGDGFPCYWEPDINGHLFAWAQW